ncbi:unnamed protein product [Prorocentrum cordatum]|uniref:Uncharacterized protein n=1 Tax=Prorocentrum cordatum TaxID=2364126 RepID=A0ABN9WT67_9DINO|nr:unnamed protein product [Polarella glacialis]
MGFEFHSCRRFWRPYRACMFLDAGGTPDVASAALAARRVSRRALRSRHRPLLAVHAEGVMEEDFTLAAAFSECVKDDLPRGGKTFSGSRFCPQRSAAMVVAGCEAVIHANGSDQDGDEYVAFRGGCFAADVSGGGVLSAISVADVDDPLHAAGASDSAAVAAATTNGVHD